MNSLVAVFVASLVGSLHCVGMCGGLVAVYACASCPTGCAKRVSVTPHLVYHAARGVGYAALGGIAGAVGALINLSGVQRGASYLAGGLMIAVGVVALLRAMGWVGGKAASAGIVSRWGARWVPRLLRLPASGQALAIGAITPALPCGWLWMFVLAAAGTGSAVWGVGVMTAFWLGSVPALLTLGLGLGGAFTAGSRLGRLRRHLPVLTALLMIGVGVLTTVQRSQKASQVAASVAPASLDAGLDAGLDSGRAPCCAGGEE